MMSRMITFIITALLLTSIISIGVTGYYSWQYANEAWFLYETFQVQHLSSGMNISGSHTVSQYTTNFHHTSPSSQMNIPIYDIQDGINTANIGGFVSQNSSGVSVFIPIHSTLQCFNFVALLPPGVLLKVNAGYYYSVSYADCMNFSGYSFAFRTDGQLWTL